jgi:amino acid transporter
LSFLGFDAVTTLAEEARGGGDATARATMLTLFVTGLLFIVQTYVLCLFALDRTGFDSAPETEQAAYDIATVIGGKWLRVSMSLFGVALAAVPSAMTAQSATSRLLFSMARDGKIPRLLSYVDRKRGTPDVAILSVAALTAALLAIFSEKLEALTTIVNFGALAGFVTLHVSVVSHFIWRRKSRDWLRHLAVPLAGLVIILYVIWHMEMPAKVMGLSWIAAGLVLLFASRRFGRDASLPDL